MSENEGDRPPSLMFIGLLPPPVDGQRLATARMRALFEDTFQLRACDIGPRNPTSPISIASRVHRTAAATLSLLTARVRGCRRLYLAPYSGNGLWLAAFLLGWGRLLGYRIAVHPHSYLAIDNRMAAMAAFTRVGGDRALYICLGASMASALRRRYSAVKRTHVLGNALMVPNASVPRQRRTAGVRPLRLGHLGNLSREKGLDTVLLTARVLADAGLPFVLELVGPASDTETETIAAAVAAHPDHVRRLGPLHASAKDAWYRSLDLFLLPTRHAHEASPLVLWEAMRAGVVPVATARGCIPEDVGDAGVLVADPRPQAFAIAVRDTLEAFRDGREDLDEASERAYARFRQSYRAAAAAFTDLIEEMVGRNGGGGLAEASPPPPGDQDTYNFI